MSSSLFQLSAFPRFKDATGQKLPATTIVREYPENYGPGREPYYRSPRPTPKRFTKDMPTAPPRKKTSPLSAASPPIATTTWTKSSAWLWANSKN